MRELVLRLLAFDDFVTQLLIGQRQFLRAAFAHPLFQIRRGSIATPPHPFLLRNVEWR